ncbi:MAG: hypothetical protein M3069_15200 [Chloroflexota bacterium]|nr:hypothetical protein [Chloroflexota bacterium]
MIGRALTIRSLWVGLTVAAAFIGPASTPIGLPDIFWTILTGAYQAAHGSTSGGDPFTSAPPATGLVLNVQWGADLLFYALNAAGGLAAVITGTAVVVAATYALLLAAAVAASGHLRLSCVAVWLAYVLGSSNLSPRPQTLAYPIFGLFLLAVMRAEWRKDTRLLWLLPPAMAVWANVHGSFFTGFVLLACAAAGRLIDARSLRAALPYACALAACVLASLVNPYGPGALVYVASIGANPVIRDFVTEWAPTSVSWREGLMFFASVGLFAALAYKSRLRLTPVELLILIVFGYLAWSSVRTIVWWGLVVAPIAARLAGGVLTSQLRVRRDRPLVNGLILAAVLGVAAFSLPWTKAAIPILPVEKRGLLSDDTPVGVGDYLRTHDPPNTGRMLNNQGWGGYLEWAAWPRHKVFLDGRIELHPPQVWFDYLDVVFPSTRWRALLDEYQITYVVLNTAEQKELVADLRQEPGWKIDYEDDQAVVFSRTISRSAGP